MSRVFEPYNHSETKPDKSSSSYGSSTGLPGGGECVGGWGGVADGCVGGWSISVGLRVS